MDSQERDLVVAGLLKKWQECIPAKKEMMDLRICWSRERKRKKEGSKRWGELSKGERGRQEE